MDELAVTQSPGSGRISRPESRHGEACDRRGTEWVESGCGDWWRRGAKAPSLGGLAEFFVPVLRGRVTRADCLLGPTWGLGSPGVPCSGGEQFDDPGRQQSGGGQQQEEEHQVEALCPALVADLAAGSGLLEAFQAVAIGEIVRRWEGDSLFVGLTQDFLRFRADAADLLLELALPFLEEIQLGMPAFGLAAGKSHGWGYFSR